jgi:hypothetical protein
MRRVFLFSVLLLCFACNNDKTEKSSASAHQALPPPPEYYFFPKANVYFDSVNKDYVFLGNDGRTWTTQKQIPAAVQAMMDKSVRIDSPLQPVWKDNINHRLIYSAALYASPSDTVQKKEPLPVTKPADSSTKEVRKSGIRRFFDKLFGKKKKNKPKES